MTRSWQCALALVTCFTLQWHRLEGRKIATCQSVCDSLGVPDGCKFATDTTREEVIVVTNGSSEIRSWKWDTITMVVSAYFSSVRSTGLTACYTHSMGKPYGLIEQVPADIPKLLGDTETVKTEFTEMILTYQKLLMADHMVFDLLGFFVQLGGSPGVNRSLAHSKMTEVLLHATHKVRDFHDREVYCIVPWNPPCGTDCREIRALLSSCQVLLMSPDSYLPVAPADGTCQAQATIPISKFLYGIDRYISLRAQQSAASSIVAGIPWHGYAYKCDQPMSDDRCVVKKSPQEACFSNSNRQRLSLSEIHSKSLTASEVKMDVVSKGLYYKLNNTAQLWFENFTTLLIKYQLTQDLQLRGLSLWYGEDLSAGMSVDKTMYAMDSWDFLTHHVLHKVVFAPRKISHYYADTVAGVAVGCLLLGTLLGVVFTCIGFRHSNLRKLNRPFKLDEDESAFRDDEGL